MSYDNYILAVATNKQVGNSVAALVAAEPGDLTAFNNAPACYPAGTTFSNQQDGPITVKVPSQPAAAWYVGVAAKQAAYDLAAEFAGAGPYPLLNALGLTDELISEKKQAVTVFAGPRATTEPNWRAHIESLGYTLP